VRANGDEIRASLGVIVFLQPDGTSVVETKVGHLLVGHSYFMYGLPRFQQGY